MNAIATLTVHKHFHNNTHECCDLTDHKNVLVICHFTLHPLI